MLTVEEALAEVLRCASPLAPRTAAIAEASGWILSDDISADRDLPPFPKAMMDGVAVRAADAVVGARLQLIEEITAGNMPRCRIEPGCAARIMTGAALPEGADAVVMIEQCRVDGNYVLLAIAAQAGQHIQPVGREMRRGQIILSAGAVLHPPALALLATIGRTAIQVFPPPSVAVLTTGDEIVEPDATPGPGQIRNSNGPMLVAQCAKAGAKPRYLGIARDERHQLDNLIDGGLSADLLILSGGVSMGARDLVPAALQERGVTQHFHKVALKPGKPLFFGTRGKTLVFGLPGNPVSSFVGFELFIRPAIMRLRGMAHPLPPQLRLPLAEAFRHSGDRPTYHPARIDLQEIGEAVRPVAWHGSPDLVGLAKADALAIFAAGERSYAAGEPVQVMRLPG